MATHGLISCTIMKRPWTRGTFKRRQDWSKQCDVVAGTSQSAAPGHSRIFNTEERYEARLKEDIDRANKTHDAQSISQKLGWPRSTSWHLR